MLRGTCPRCNADEVPVTIGADDRARVEFHDGCAYSGLTADEVALERAFESIEVLLRGSLVVTAKGEH